MTDKIVAFTTCERHEQALIIARHLVDREVAACVNIVPNVTSVYRWKGQVEEAEEWLLIIKTSAPLFENLKLELAALHTYDVPELIGISIVDGTAPYLDWLSDNLRGGTDGGA